MSKRVFFAEVETVYHKDYQCDYYRGVIIDERNNIADRCSDLQPSYGKAKRDAERKLMNSPLYSRQTSPEMKAKLEEYQKQKAEFEKQNAVFIYDPKEWNEWQYLYDHGLYRFRYMNQNSPAGMTLTRLSKTPIGPMIAKAYDRAGTSDLSFYLGRIRQAYDLENLPGYKDIWKINSVTKIIQKENRDCDVIIRFQKYGNLRHDFKKKEKEKIITIKSKWDCFNELMERFYGYYHHY